MARIALVILILLLIPVLAFGIYVLYTRYRAKRANLPPPPLPFFGRRSNPFSDRNATEGGGNGGAGGGILNTIRSKIPFLNKSNRRTGAGAYEQSLAPSGGGSRSAGRRGLDPDEAWDTRVGNEADGYGQGGGYYEEQESGFIRPALNHSTYSGGGYGDRLTNNNNKNTAVIPEYGGSSFPLTSSPEEPKRGRSRSREATDYIGGGRQQQRQRGSGLDDARLDEEKGFQQPGPGSKKDNNDPFADNTAERSDLRGEGMGLRPVVETEARRGVSPFGLSAHGNTESGLVGNSPTERRSLFRENI